MRNAKQEMVHPAHARNWDLLPWYHNGSLGGDERLEVEAHLGECLMCVRELRRLEQLTVAVAAPAHEHACTQAFLRLSAQIRARQGSWRGRLLAALRAVAEPAPALAGVALLVAAVLVGTAILNENAGSRAPDRSFRTLGRQPALPSALSHPLVRVVLRDNLAPVSVDAWLGRYGAEVVNGPSAIGVLTVRVALGPRALDTVLAEMRADQEALFVEPVDVIGTRPDRRR